MSMCQQVLTEHCNTIIKSARIRNRIVILCEGDVPNSEIRTPSEYGKMEKMPDANFYKACVPRWWKNYLPQFFNCGDRKDVIDTYFKLMELHKAFPNNSFLDPDKLFAVVDLDLQLHKINENYPFQDTDEIFYNLYKHAEINETDIVRHRIWITGLVHKEAYFLLPAIQDIFTGYHIQPFFDGIPLNLEKLYVAMSDAIDIDNDLQNNFDRASKRIQYCPMLQCQDVYSLKNSWQINFKSATDDSVRNELVIALLMIKKAKEHWNQIIPDPDSGWTRKSHIFREDLALKIGGYYSAQTKNSKEHIPMFFKMLFQTVTGLNSI
ncbi:MAG: hypothetical protein ABRQ39_14690 [Candidatus Eremiobacterota bacterium]